MSKTVLTAMLFTVSLVGFAEVPAPNSTVTVTETPREVSPTVKFGALLQAFSLMDDTSTARNQLNFRLRRAEVKVSGSIVENTRYFLMVDPAKTLNNNGDNKILQDLGVGFSPVKGFEILGGQFKTLTTAEGLTSSSELMFPERSLVGRTFGDRREPGLMVSYDAQVWKIGAMVSNGQGTNADAASDTKDLSVRVDGNPAREMKLGAFVALGDFKYDERSRWGTNARFSPGDFTVGAEYAMGRDKGINSLGLVFDTGYFITPEIQPVARYEILKGDVNTALVSEQTSLGVNYHLAKNRAKIQIAASYLSHMSGNNGSPKAQKGIYGGLFTGNLQMAL